MQDPLYREIIMDHWSNPQNFGVVKKADIDLVDNNPLCGDEVRLTAKIKDGKITDIKFSGEGCAISRASASLFTEKIKGMAVADVKKITPKDVLKDLGLDLTPARMKCCLLVYTTTQKALK